MLQYCVLKMYVVAHFAMNCGCCYSFVNKSFVFLDRNATGVMQ
jgi:hypothetical protein